MAGKRAALAALALAGAAVAVFGVLAPPEHCPAVSADELRASATQAVDWFTRNQQEDGTWLYLYDAGADDAAADYNIVRHAGAAMGLYQAATAGIPGARASADRGVEWALDRLVERDGWAAVRDGGTGSVGATALLAAGLAERRADTGDERWDQEMAQLGRFLLAQTEPSGAVSARYELATGRPAAEHSIFYTGEAYWALARLHRLFPDGPWGEGADRIGAYLATRRDRDEDLFPPTADHWAAYGLAETTAFPDRPADRPLTDDEVAYVRRQAGLFGAQVRWVSQRFGPWGLLVRGPHTPRGGGYGVIGEGLTGLWRAADADPRLADLRAPLAARAVCNAGIAIQEQASASDADRAPVPDRVRGAWFRDGETRMDDQQHALAALLRTVAIVEAGDAGSSGSSHPSPSAWLWLVALLAAFDPCRIALGLPREGRSRREVASLAAIGGGLGALAVLLVSLLSGPLLDLLNVSTPALRIAAGAVGAVAGTIALAGPTAAPDPAPPGWRAALVPVAFPLVVRPALVFLALSAHADRGVPLVALALALGVALLVAVSSRAPRAAARATAAVLVGAAVLLVIDGVMAV